MSVRADIIDKLEIALNGLKTNDAYELVPKKVSPFIDDYQGASKGSFPWIMIQDADPETKAIEDPTHITYYASISLLGFVKTDTESELTAELNKMLSTFKQFVDEGPSLGDNVLAVEYVGTDGNKWNPDDGIGLVDAKIRIIYWCERGSF